MKWVHLTQLTVSWTGFWWWWTEPSTWWISDHRDQSWSHKSVRTHHTGL